MNGDGVTEQVAAVGRLPHASRERRLDLYGNIDNSGWRGRRRCKPNTRGGNINVGPPYGVAAVHARYIVLLGLAAFDEVYHRDVPPASPRARCFTRCARAKIQSSEPGYIAWHD